MIYDSICAQARAVSRRSLAAPLSPAAWRAGLTARRRRWLDMLGLDPLPPRTPLKVRITGRLERGDYTVDLLHFQSLPGAVVPGTLYRPARAAGRLPAVLYLCGHSRAGKATPLYQAQARWFGRHGYVALSLDPIQVGEGQGIHHGTYHFGRWDWISRGYTPAAAEVWNAMRALDYLAARPDVDSRRLGVTGLSGGGAISWFLAAADTRVACAAPVCQTGTIEQHAVDRTIDSHCDCAFWVNTEQWCTPDLGALIAPRPLLVAAGTDDPLWRPYAFREALRRIRRQYAALGVPGNVRLVEDAATHGYTPALSRAVYAWFQRHLQGHTGPVDGPDARPAEPPAALRVFHGRPPARNRMKDMDRRLIRLAPDPGSPGRADWKRRSRAIRAALRRGPFRYVPADGGLERLIEMRNDGAAALVYRSYLFDQADGLRLRLRTAAPASFHPARDAGVAFALSPDAQSSRGLPGARNLAPGRLIACIEVRNTGDHSVGPGYAWTLRRTYPLLGQSLPERQVSDLLAGITLLRRETGLRRLAVFGAGHTAVLALYAALLNPSITELILEAPPTTHTDPATPEIPGILKVGDLPELLGAVYPRPITIRGALPAAYRWTARLYRRLGAGARFRRLPADAPWTPWAG